MAPSAAAAAAASRASTSRPQNKGQSMATGKATGTARPPNTPPSIATKRKKVVVPMEQKLEAIKRLDNGETLQKVADDYGVGRVTVGDWRRNRLEIEKWCSTRVTDGAAKERKTMKKCGYEKVSEALYVWFLQFRDRSVPISGPILQQKALHFRKEFDEGDPDFTASVGWLDRWKKRYGIRQLCVCGEKLSSDFQEMEAFQNLTISHGDGVRALEIAMKYIEQQEEATGVDIMMLQRWRALAVKKRQSSGKQKRITDFFKFSD